MFLKDVKCAKYNPQKDGKILKMKGEQIGRKVRKIKFPQYIIDENFKKIKTNFMFLF